MGGYEIIRDMLSHNYPSDEINPLTGAPVIPLWQKITAGIVAGGIGAAIANPTDLVKVRLQAEGKLKPGQVNYYRFLSCFLDSISTTSL